MSTKRIPVCKDGKRHWWVDGWICSKCGGTGVRKFYYDAGDHFGAGTAPNSEWRKEACECMNTAKEDAEKRKKSIEKLIAQADSYWGEDGRCRHCSAGDDAHHSYTCPTGKHSDKRPVEAGTIKDLMDDTVKPFIRYGPVSTAGAGKVKPPFDDFWGEVEEPTAEGLTAADAGIVRLASRDSHVLSIIADKIEAQVAEPSDNVRTEPYAMVPLGPNGELVRVEFGQELEFWDVPTKVYKERFVGYGPLDGWEGLWFYSDNDSYKYARFPKQKPPRPEIAIDEPVWLIPGDWPRLFAEWDENGRPVVWADGKHSHTATRKFTAKAIKTKDGTIWPPEET